MGLQLTHSVPALRMLTDVQDEEKGRCKVEKLKIQPCIHYRQQVERVEKEDSSQEKRAGVALQST